MKLIAGLGNPGDQYARTRHNAGFMVVDELAARTDGTWSFDKKFGADVARATISGQDTILVKPQTFMNLSGEALQKVAQFYKIALADIWVIFDDVDTPFGRLRLRQGGSGSGHQGVNSTIRHLGEAFIRVKFGISLNDRTRESSEVYVLKAFPSDEREHLPAALAAAASIVEQQLTRETVEPSTFELF